MRTQISTRPWAPRAAFEALYQQIVVAVYGGVIVLSALFQGGTALYYFSRRRHVEDFIAETPAWVRDVQSGTLPA